MFNMHTYVERYGILIGFQNMAALGDQSKVSVLSIGMRVERDRSLAAAGDRWYGADPVTQPLESCLVGNSVRPCCVLTNSHRMK